MPKEGVIAYRTNKTKEEGFKILFLVCASLSILFLLAICIFLIVYSAPFLSKYGLWSFLTGSKYNSLGENPTFGIAAMILTSLLVTLLSCLVGCFLGLLTSIALYRFVPHKLVRPVKAMIDLLASIPSVIYGLVGLVVVVPMVRAITGDVYGYGILSASIVLSIMILPTMVSVSLDALHSVDTTYYEGALALGSTPSQAVFKVILPAAKSGIFAALVLSCGRALGETMAVVMVIGGGNNMPTSLVLSVEGLTSNIARHAMEATGDAFDALLACGLVLFFLSVLINIGFAILKGKSKPKKRHRWMTSSKK